MSDRLVALSLSEFAHRVSDRSPLPGSGCVAAAVGALGAALGIMVLRSAPCEGEESRLVALRDALLDRVDRDATAYRAFLDARRGGGDTKAALEEATRVPSEIAELSLTALEGLAGSVHDVRPALACECWTAAQTLVAAVESATTTARANLPPDELGRGGETGSRAAELDAHRRRAHELLADVDRALGARA